MAVVVAVTRVMDNVYIAFCARHCSKCSPYTNSFNPLVILVLLVGASIIVVLRKGNRSSVRVRDSPRDRKLGKGRTVMCIPGILLSKSELFIRCHALPS